MYPLQGADVSIQEVAIALVPHHPLLDHCHSGADISCIRSS